MLNAKVAAWRHAEGRGAYSVFEDEPEFAPVGINVVVLGPSEPMSMYHWEAKAGVEKETTDADEAYASVVKRKHTRYREGWLSELG